MHESLIGLTQYFWRQETPWLVAMALLLSFVLARYRKEDRGSVKNTLALFLFAFVGQLFSAVTEAIAGLPQAAETFYELFAIVIGLTLIRLWGMLIFRILLPWFRFRPPVILEDIVIAVGYFSWGLVRLRLKMAALPCAAGSPE